MNEILVSVALYTTIVMFLVGFGLDGGLEIRLLRLFHHRTDHVDLVPCRHLLLDEMVDLFPGAALH